MIMEILNNPSSMYDPCLKTNNYPRPVGTFQLSSFYFPFCNLLATFVTLRMSTSLEWRSPYFSASASLAMPFPLTSSTSSWTNGRIGKLPTVRVQAHSSFFNYNFTTSVTVFVKVSQYFEKHPVIVIFYTKSILFTGRNYTDSQEEKFRLKIFMENKAKIAKHNIRASRGEKTYFLKMNHLGDQVNLIFFRFNPCFGWSLMQWTSVGLNSVK